jgi:hypothetical protein
MDTQITISSPQETVILAYGTSNPTKKIWRWVIGGIITAIVILAVGFWLLLRSAFALPQGTVFTVSISPNKARAYLGEEQIHKLPLEWTNAINTSSNWPITLGLAKQEDEWKPFALQPRWMGNGRAWTRKGLVIMPGILEDDLRLSTSTIRYTDQLAQHWLHPLHQGFITGDLSPLFPSTTSTETLAFKGKLKKNLILTDIPFERGPMATLAQGDISLNLQENLFGGQLMEIVRTSLFLGETFPFLQEDYSAVAITLDEAFRPITTQLQFSEPLNKAKISHILGAWGMLQKREVLFPDGTRGFEQVVLTEIAENEPLSVHPTLGKLSIQGQELVLSKEEQTKSLPPLLSCKGVKPTLHLSKKTVQRLFEQHHLPFFLKGSGIQLGEKDQQLVICFED